MPVVISHQRTLSPTRELMGGCPIFPLRASMDKNDCAETTNNPRRHAPCREYLCPRRACTACVNDIDGQGRSRTIRPIDPQFPNSDLCREHRLMGIVLPPVTRRPFPVVAPKVIVEGEVALGVSSAPRVDHTDPSLEVSKWQAAHPPAARRSASSPPASERPVRGHKPSAKLTQKQKQDITFAWCAQPQCEFNFKEGSRLASPC
jgi:hypothetical protein